MMAVIPATLVIELLSDTTFGRGEGTPGVVDVEVEHDAYGLPMLGGKALRGLVRDSWLSMQAHFPELVVSGRRVLGPHADVDEAGIVRIGDATIDAQARRFFVWSVKREQHRIAPATILAALTDVRAQTAEDRRSGAPSATTLRSTRVTIRGLRLIAQLNWLVEPDMTDLRCLALAALATRHGGLGRNRGRGHLRITIEGDVERTRDLARGVS